MEFPLEVEEPLQDIPVHLPHSNFPDPLHLGILRLKSVRKGTPLAQDIQVVALSKAEIIRSHQDILLVIPSEEANTKVHPGILVATLSEEVTINETFVILQAVLLKDVTTK